MGFESFESSGESFARGRLGMLRERDRARIVGQTPDRCCDAGIA
jgi:hypothetical protein